MFWWLIKKTTKKQVKSTFQTTVDTNCQWVCPFTGNNFYQTVVFFFPVDVHNVHIPDWIQCTDGSETLPFFFLNHLHTGKWKRWCTQAQASWRQIKESGFREGGFKKTKAETESVQR